MLTVLNKHEKFFRFIYKKTYYFARLNQKTKSTMTKSKLKLLTAGLVILFLFSNFMCSKDDNVPASTWTVGTTSYTGNGATRSTFSGYSLSVDDGNNNAFTIHFPAFPSAGGSYTIAKYSTGGNPSGTLASNQISVDAALSTNDEYLSTGSDNVTATVSVTDGKISVTFPACWAQHYSSGGVAPDSLQLSGTVVEK